MLVQVSDGDRFPLPPCAAVSRRDSKSSGPSLRRRSLPSATASNTITKVPSGNSPSLRRRSLPSATWPPSQRSGSLGFVQVSDGDRFPLPRLLCDLPANLPVVSKSPTEIASLCHTTAPEVFDRQQQRPSLRRRSLPSATGRPRRRLEFDRVVQVSDGDRFPLPLLLCGSQVTVDQLSKSPTEIASLCHANKSISSSQAALSSKSPTEIASLCHGAMQCVL